MIRAWAAAVTESKVCCKSVYLRRHGAWVLRIESYFTILVLVFSPSETKMSPVGAITTSLGILNS
jgi:hypothetical protein